MTLSKEHICSCGRSIPAPRNSTIWAKQCPSCTLKDAFKKKSSNKVSLSSKHKNKSSVLVSKSPKLRAMERADMWFSRYIRLKYSHEYSGHTFCKCYTCGNLHDIKLIDCGHYVNREHKTVRFNENNSRPQCTYCNRYRSGRHLEFGVKLASEIGAEEFDNLRQLSLFPGEDNEIFYREQAKIFRNKFNQLIKEMQICNPWKK